MDINLPSESNSKPFTYIARQPILDLKGDLIAFELLYRNSTSNFYPSSVSPEEATQAILVEHFLTSTGSLLEGKLGFVNFDENSLMSGLVYDFPPNDVVIEILETCEPTDLLFEKCRELKERGYLIALDDYEPDERWERFYPFVDYIKLDIQALSIPKCLFLIRSLKEFDIKFLAEKVETYEEFEKTKRCGFELFQGYFFTKPQIIKNIKLSSSTSDLIELSKIVSASEFEYTQIEKIISRSAAMSFQVLKYANNTGVRNPIKDLKQALAYLGNDKIKKFSSYAMMTQLGADKPSILHCSALYRAKFIENIASLFQKTEVTDLAYLCGLLSLVDAMLDMKMNVIMSEVNLDKSLVTALVSKQGLLGNILLLTEALEVSDWSAIRSLCITLGIEEHEVIAMAIEADLWVSELEST
ncbi:HDOD domain-containing protein [Vibrio sp. 99-70-13A1]|uniref:EAL and HDOD domain-containing protein n=1 Tax=Vibrio sp. 99-70-13A1 TaxID=2607601 RepID=UPI001493BB4E|nr:HDOD domain-containing protein [Vibrio sp. 99-70-13A1]NOH95679.1 EAL domain-containing protein [Vibrio sp. 99-70-13A1]